MQPGCVFAWSISRRIHVITVMFTVMVTVISMFTKVTILNIVIIMMAFSARYMKSFSKEWCRFSPAVGA